MCCFVVGLHSLQSRENEIQQWWILPKGVGKKVVFICLYKCCLPHDCFLHLYLFSLWSGCSDPVYPQLFILGNSLCCCTAKFLSLLAILLKFQKREEEGCPCSLKKSNGKDHFVQTWTWWTSVLKGSTLMIRCPLPIFLSALIKATYKLLFLRNRLIEEWSFCQIKGLFLQCWLKKCSGSFIILFSNRNFLVMTEEYYFLNSKEMFRRISLFRETSVLFYIMTFKIRLRKKARIGNSICQ